MKKAIAALEDNEESDISPVGGRAPFWLIFDGKKLVKKIKNPFRFGGGGAGFSVAKMLIDEKVDLVVCGRLGPNMQSALDAKGIKTKLASGKVKDQL